MTAFAEHLLAWYDDQGRTLPWRVKGGKADPYRVWVSEIMLQQTTVSTVLPYFQTFMARWPTLADLGRASLDEILHLWQGLGYYTRARALHACAKKLLEEGGGRFPETEKELLALPGIGPYTAGAILTIAFEKPAVAMDGNIIRVLSRYRALSGTGLPLKKAVYREGLALLPEQRLGDYTQALMDLGAQLCTPRLPQCGVCPVSQDCYAYIGKQTHLFPEKAAPQIQPLKYGDVFWIERMDGAIFFQKEESKRLLGGLMRPLLSPFEPIFKESPLFPMEGDWQVDPSYVTHVFTHFKLILRLWRIQVTHLPALTGLWIHPRDFQDYAFSTLVQKVIRTLSGLRLSY